MTATAGDDATLSLDSWEHNEVAVRMEAVWLSVTREVIDDAVAVGGLVERALDRMLHPWRYPDRNPMPPFVALPRLDRAHRRVVELHRRIVGMPQRLRDARYVLRHGLPERDDDW